MRLTDAGQQLFPELRAALDRIGAAVAAMDPGQANRPLVVTTTRAIASRWLIPRMNAVNRDTELPGLAVHATETVEDLHRGDADFAIRYSHIPPAELESRLLFADHYAVVCDPSLIDHELQDIPLIHFDWKADDAEAPTWPCWVAHARQHDPQASLPDADSGLHFSEETHAIEAALRGQGMALLSTELIRPELESGALIQPVELTIEGRRAFAVFRPDHPRLDTIERSLKRIQSHTLKK